MKTKGKAAQFAEALIGTAYFPHWLSFLIDNPLRVLLISPATLAERLSLRPEARILEVGAGSGYFSVALAERVPLGHLEILDLQAEMLAKARRKIEKTRLSNVGFTQSDAGSLPFPDASFDFAVLVAVLGEVPDEEKCLQSLRRVLRPGGVVAFHEHLPDPDFIKPDAPVKSRKRILYLPSAVWIIVELHRAFYQTRLTFPGRDVVESNQIDVFALAVLRDFKKIEYAKKPGGEGQCRSDIGEPDRFD